MNQEPFNQQEIELLVSRLREETRKLHEREQDLEDQKEELSSQKEELTAAIEALVAKNRSLEDTLNQLRERSFELDQILYRTSHDLRSPLSSIKGILSLLDLEPQSDVVRSYGKHIADKTTQMDNLLRSLASLSKAILEEPQFEIINLDKIIGQVVDEYRHVPSWASVEVRIELCELKIFTDPALIIIILQSLVSNAFNFRDSTINGTLTIRTQEQTGIWIIDVIDDGEGIDPSVEPYIFNMFYRGSERSLGSGLGLYVCRKAVERLMGNVSVHHAQHTTHFRAAIPLLNIPEGASTDNRPG